MIQYTTQNNRELKHISLLRRVFLRKQTGILHVVFGSGEQAQLRFHQGRLIGQQKDIENILRDYLTEYVEKIAWEDKPMPPPTGWVAVWIALTDALNHAFFEQDRLEVYVKAFSRLPAVVLKNCPVHRLDFADEDTYLVLYHLSLDVASFQLKLFFGDGLSSEEKQKRVRTVLLVFLLGYLKAAPKTSGNKQGKVSMAARILQRLRGA